LSPVPVTTGTRLEDRPDEVERIASPPVNPLPIVLFIAVLVLLIWGLAWLP
jgi:hypothetical protein